MGALLENSARMAWALALPASLAACSSGAISVGDDRVPVVTGDSGMIDMGSGGVGGAGGGADANQMDVADAFSPPTAGDLAGVTATCAKQISNGLLSPRPGKPQTVQVCELSNAIFWTSGLAVLCSGKITTTCNKDTDPLGFQPMTTATDSNGDYLDAAALPYVEVSAPSSTFDYRMFSVKMGSVVAVVNRGRQVLAYGIVGTEGQKDIIGDASYAMAKAIEEDPDPVGGGTTNPITYIVFNNPAVTVTANESHDEAVKLGQVAAAALVRAGK
jgi:hypothetical protein